MSRSRSSSRGSRAKRQQSRTRLILVVVVVAVVLVGLLIVLSQLGQGETAVALDRDYDVYTQEADRSEDAVGYAIGSPDAPATLVEYSDFSCPHCFDLSVVMHDVIDEYVADGSVRVVFKPISFVNPPYSAPAAAAAVCAGEQGKFWEMHDQIWALYEQTGPGAYVPSNLNSAAQAIGLDTTEFRRCYNDSETASEVTAVITEAQSKGITGTPTMFLNGEPLPYRGAEVAYTDIANAIEAVAGE